MMIQLIHFAALQELEFMCYTINSAIFSSSCREQEELPNPAHPRNSRAQKEGSSSTINAEVIIIDDE
jgi:hypothetical protein